MMSITMTGMMREAIEVVREHRIANRNDPSELAAGMLIVMTWMAGRPLTNANVMEWTGLSPWVVIPIMRRFRAAGIVHKNRVPAYASGRDDFRAGLRIAIDAGVGTRQFSVTTGSTYEDAKFSVHDEWREEWRDYNLSLAIHGRRG